MKAIQTAGWRLLISTEPSVEITTKQHISQTQTHVKSRYFMKFVSHLYYPY